MSEDPLFPIQIYIYNQDGTYGEPIQINSEGQLNSPGTRMILNNAVASGVEVRMTDPGDSLVFHAIGGRILYPPG